LDALPPQKVISLIHKRAGAAFTTLRQVFGPGTLNTRL
jgi:hypothetical protein